MPLRPQVWQLAAELQLWNDLQNTSEARLCAAAHQLEGWQSPASLQQPSLLPPS